MSLFAAEIMKGAIFGPVREKTQQFKVWATMLSVPKMGISQTEFSLTCPMIANGWALFYRHSGHLLSVCLCTSGRNWIQYISRDAGRPSHLTNYTS
jgi:hypothetical protein